MTTAIASADQRFGPWNPGIRSPLPRELRHLATVFRPENIYTALEYAEELRDLSGLELTEIVAFRPERLALHELLVRITADLSVPDGQRIEDLGINFREMTRVILARYVSPQMPSIVARYEVLHDEISACVVRELDRLFGIKVEAPKRGVLSAFFARRPGGSARRAANSEDASRAAAEWQRSADASVDPVERAAKRALSKCVSVLLARHGRLWGSREMIASLATSIAGNQAGSEAIGQLIEPLVAAAAEAEGYRRLRAQQFPVVMNTKGPSASGKSTIRPLQRTLAGFIGVDWGEFALVSPDIWRKQLLDYGSLGPHYKYAGACTGDELHVIDQKLDAYMARKGERNAIPHLLIDRFRFDSFAPDSDEPGSNLLTRFGHVVYLFFLITPPEALVERAWARGLEVGRYKAVDDLLAHAVEAYSGMPELFFTWIRRADKRVHFEFLDNSVPQGERPRTVAFGWNDTLTVFDIGCMLDVHRYRSIDVDATSPQTLYRDRSALAPERNTSFLRQCVERFAEVNFADRRDGRICARLIDGALAWADPAVLGTLARDDDARAGLAAVGPGLFGGNFRTPDQATFVAAAEKRHTVGAWGLPG
jgi:hypothetical protein